MSKEGDPHAERPTQWIGKTARFDHQGKRLTGEVIAQEYVGRRGPSSIPDYSITIRGAIGATMTASLFDTYMTFDD